MNITNFPKTSLSWLLFFVILLIILGPLRASSSQGVIVAPTRVVFEGRTRSQVVRLVNPDSKPQRFRISLVNIRMDDQGTRKITDLPNSNEIISTNMIRFSPRQVTLPPNGWQTIRLMVRKPQDLADGEYRVHLKMASIPEPKKPVAENQLAANKVGIQINILMDVTIPLIIRHGQGGVEATPQKAILKVHSKTGEQFVELEIARSGSHSLFADIVLFTDSGDGGESVQLGQNQGVSIYTPNKRQFVNVAIAADHPDIKGKNIRVEIHDRQGGEKTLISSSTLLLQDDMP